MGAVSGKIGGVVGAKWKSIAYLRSYSKPGGVATALQLAQQARMTYMVAAAKPFVGRILDPYRKKFLPTMSGFNRVVSDNIPVPPATAPVVNLLVTDGPLYPGSALLAVEVGVTGVFTITWGVEHGVDGLDDDIAIAWMRDSDTNLVAFSANSTRVAGTTTAGELAMHGAPNLEAGVFFVKLINTIVNKISRNLSYSIP